MLAVLSPPSGIPPMLALGRDARRLLSREWNAAVFSGLDTNTLRAK